MLNKKLLLSLIVLSIVLCFCITIFSFAAVVDWSKYPEKTVHLIHPSNPGGGDDLIIQTFKPFLEKYLGTDVVSVYKQGAGMMVAWGYIVNETEPDGYTLGMSKALDFSVTEIMRKEEKEHNWEDIVPLYNLVIDPNILIVKGDSPINTLDDYIQYCKDNPRMITLSSTSVGGDDWLAVKLLEKAAGIECIVVPYESDSYVIQSLLGGHIESSILNVGGVAAILGDGRAKPLVVFAEKRVDSLPDVPTAVELGYNVIEGSARGFAFLKGTPIEAIEIMEKALHDAANDPGFLEKAKEIGLNIVPMNKEDYANFMNSKLEEYKILFKELGMEKLQY